MTPTASPGPETLVVVSADDLGWDSSRTRAILDALAAGAATHASLIPNLGGFDEACALVHDRGLAARIGLHLNLSDGRPLTDAMAASPRFCAEGVFRFPPRHAWLMPVSKDDARAVAGEVRAQIAAVRARGLPLSHFDSHHHVHSEPHLARIVGALVKEAGIARLRPARNCGPSHGLIRSLKSRWYNGWLEAQGMRGVRYFGGVDDIAWLRRAPRGLSVEIMVHPTFDADGVIVDGPSRLPVADCARRVEDVAAGAH